MRNAARFILLLALRRHGRTYFIMQLPIVFRESHNNHSNGFIYRIPGLNQVDEDVELMTADECGETCARARESSHIIRLW